jgi:hypothetical protein
MGRIPGSPKTGGRRRGTPNRATDELRQLVESRLQKTLPEAVIECLSEVTPKDRLRALLELMNFIYPKRKAIEPARIICEMQDDRTAGKIKKLLTSPNGLELLEKLEELSGPIQAGPVFP